MNATDKLSVTLEAQQWDVMIRVLSDGPYRIVATLIQEIQRQAAEVDALPPKPEP